MTDSPRMTRETPVPKPGIVHFGPGAFFRAFNAVYTDDVLKEQGGDWGIVAVSLQSDRAVRELAPQGCAYTTIALSEGAQEARVVNSICKVLAARENPQAVLDVLSDPAIRIVSLTITEKGYCYDSASGGLDTDLAEVQVDLAHPARPQTAVGYIVEALACRRVAGHRPFTVLSCDNLPDNGKRTRRVVLDFARLRDASLAEWIAAEGRFPSSMVDRITPATTVQDIDALAAKTGVKDLACVYHEPFRQWVIEDDFVDSTRPDWTVGGAQFVISVEAHEKMKLRCLNGTHSTLAYLGYLAGYETVADTVADPVFSGLCSRLWEREILTTVPEPEGENLQAYTDALLKRYRNKAIRHLTWQIAMDGSQKLPQRILATIRERLAQGDVPHGLCLAVAAWMIYVSGTDLKGQPIDVRDPLADRLKAATQAALGPAETVTALLAERAVFDHDLAEDAVFRETLIDSYETIWAKGARGAVEQYLTG